nr:hypothetical protein Iba_scaffold66282CG0010 [Ipomoea batatas]
MVTKEEDSRLRKGLREISSKLPPLSPDQFSARCYPLLDFAVSTVNTIVPP